jgi:hypothetical protein
MLAPERPRTLDFAATSCVLGESFDIESQFQGTELPPPPPPVAEAPVRPPETEELPPIPSIRPLSARPQGRRFGRLPLQP